MTLSEWLECNECDEERRVAWAIKLAQLSAQCTDGHLNPERIDVDAQENLTLNESDIFLEEYSAPETFKDNDIRDFSTTVFSCGIIIDELLRKAAYTNFRELTEYIEGDADTWFKPCQNDALEDILRVCLGAVQLRPQTPEDLKKLFLNNEKITQYLQNHPENKWASYNNNSADNPAEEDTGLAIGIDLGTSNSVVAYYKDGRYNFLEVKSRRLIPSAIFFRDVDQNKWVYGNAALSRGVMYPAALFKHFKRHIGESQFQTFHVEPHGTKDTSVKRKYIIDTNIFIEDPRILEGFGDDVEILIPKTVYEELGRRKNSKNTQDEVEVVLQSIEDHKDIISLEDSHPELLTADMFQSADKNNNDRNDSKILSVALYHDSDKTFLISNDKVLAQKAEWQKHKFHVQNYETFSLYRHVTSQSNTADELKLTGKDGAAFFLQFLRNEIRKKIGYVNKAVITVPQEFSAIQHNEIKEAAIQAGFTEIELQKEPMAAAVAYGLELSEDQTILVYDFGGGTFDVTVLRISDGNFIRLTSGGDDKLGGEDFTKALIEDFKDKLSDGEILPDDETLDMFDEEKSELSHEEFMQNELKIWEACEDMKCLLSSSDSALKIITLYVSSGNRVDVEYELSANEFEDITCDLMVKARKALDGVLNKVSLMRTDINTVILAGGTSLIPGVAKMVEEYFGKKPLADRDPSTLIAEGAALFADMKWNQQSTISKKVKIFDKTMSDFGVSLKGRIFDTIIPVNSVLPIRKEKIYSLVRDYQSELLIECFTRDENSSATRIMDESIKYIGKVKISNLPSFKQHDVDVCVTFNLTKEYELAVEVDLKDMHGNGINQTKVKIDTVGI